MDGGDFLISGMFTVTMISGVAIIYLALRQRSESLERQHRERMAMIEKGQVPPPQPVRRGGASNIAMSLGIITIGLGFALMTIISIAAGEAGVGVGIGGAIVIVGVSFIVRSLVVRPAEPEPRAPIVPPVPPQERL